jgi:tetratricopeptide (TPR) repeat protein
VSAKDPDFPQVRELLQKVQGQAEDHRVEETSPQNKLQGETYYKQGLLLYRQRHYAEARDCWRKVLTVDPGHAEAKRGLERIEAILQALK